MIVAIADDLTGAAEVAGIAACYGLRAEVQLEFDATTEAQFVAIDTQTRSCHRDEAVRRVRQIARDVTAAAPQAIFKKTDSILRGNVCAELEAIMEVTNAARTWLLPANPGKHRTIRGGRYFVHNTLLHDTHFRLDAEHPRDSATVDQLLDHTHTTPLAFGAAASPQIAQGIVVPDVVSEQDLSCWANAWNPGTLAAGAAEFLQAMLARWSALFPTIADSTKHAPPETAFPVAQRSLFVCGSQAAWRLGLEASAKKHGVCVLPMPKVILDQLRDWKAARGAISVDNQDACDTSLTQWVREAVQAFGHTDWVMMAIGRSADEGAEPAWSKAESRALLWPLIHATSCVYAHSQPDRIAIEGGETASIWVRRQGWKRFTVSALPCAGVGLLRPLDQSHAPALLIKPGSYSWPEDVWRQAQQSGYTVPGQTKNT